MNTLCIDESQPGRIQGPHALCDHEVPAPDCALEAYRDNEGRPVVSQVVTKGPPLRRFPVLYTERDLGPGGDGRCYLLLDEAADEAVVCLSPGFRGLVEVRRVQPYNVSIALAEDALDAMCHERGPMLDEVSEALGRRRQS